MIMKRIAFVIFTMFFVFGTNAETVELDGIYYNLITKGKVAEVTSGAQYTGNISIPEKFTYGGIEYSVTIIGKNAFKACSNLLSVTIPISVTLIDDNAFQNCTSLTTVNIPNSITTINYGTFNGCSSLTSIVIPESVTNIGEHAFSFCNSLYSIVIPNSVISIGSYAFKNCKGMVSFTMGNGVKSLGKEVFTGCNKLGSVHISDVAAWCSISFVQDDSNPLTFAHHLFLYDAEIKDLIVPDNVKSIGYAAFRGCRGLTSVTIPDNVTFIGKFAFENCANMANITIPNGLTVIRERTFCGCHSLSSVTIPEKTTSIEYGAFWDCTNLTSITIPDNVISIGERAFAACENVVSVELGKGVKKVYEGAFGSCPKLENVYCYAVEAPTASILAFNDSYIEYATLHVPSSALESYKATAPWRTFGTIIALTEESAINSVPVEMVTKTTCYTIGGQLTNAQNKGIRIVKTSDGTAKKVIIE